MHFVSVFGAFGEFSSPGLFRSGKFWEPLMSTAKSRILLGLIVCLGLIGSTMDDFSDPSFRLGLILLALFSFILIRLERFTARRRALAEAGDDYFLISTECFLDWTALSDGLDPGSLRLLSGLLNQGRQDGRFLRPGLKKAVRRLKEVCRRRPEDPGPWAYRSWGLSLLACISAREAMLLGRPGRAARFRSNAGFCRDRALDSAPGELKASILADWGRALETEAEDSEDGRPLPLLEQALAKYRQAVTLDPDQAGAWRGQGRVLGFLALSCGGTPRRPELEKAVEMYERARRVREWDGAFYDEFGLAALRLAENNPSRAVHFYRYSAKLFIMASELKGESASSLFMAGKCLHLAGLNAGDICPASAAGLQREALEPLREAAELDPDDHWSFLWAARCLQALYNLAEDEGEAEADFLRRALRLCARAARAAAGEEVYSEWGNILCALAERGGPEAPRHWEEAAEKYGLAAACEELNGDRAAVNWHNWGYALAGQAAALPSAAERHRVLMEAAVKYRQAARLNSDNLITLENLGDILGDLAETAAGPAEAGHFYQEADLVFQRAAELYPYKAGPWRRWGAVLRNRAQTEKNPARRREIWEDCLSRLAAGVEAEPGDASTWVLWGQALSQRYWESPEHERAWLVDDIIAKYERAAELEPEDDEIRSLLGRSRLEASELPAEAPGSAGALGQVVRAVEELKTASRLNPEYSGHWADWGRALFRQAQLTENEASILATMAEAREKFETAVALDPAASEHHSGLGHILYQWGWRLEEPRLKREKFKEAYGHCAQAGNLAPHDPTVWRNWAKVAEALANVEKDPRKSFDWQNEANEKHYRADTLDSGQLKDRRH